MFAFLIVFAVSLLALLAVQDMDVECNNQQIKARRHTAARPAPDGKFPPLTAMREVR